MNITAIMDRKAELEEKIWDLPRGYISKKTINNNISYYLQWKENGKTKSKYIQKSQLENVKEGIEKRKQLEAELKQVVKLLPKNMTQNKEFATYVVKDNALKVLVKEVKDLKKRDCFEYLQNFLNTKHPGKICAVYGLRRTGKTVMLLQAISEMSNEDFDKTVYIKIQTNDSLDDLIFDLNKLRRNGYTNIFIDEVTLLDEFSNAASIFSDVYAMQEMNIVLSGTDSLGFYLAAKGELYDRVTTINTTYIPFREHKKLLGTSSIDEYIRYGGTLKLGKKDYLHHHLYNEESETFLNETTTRDYIDSSIAKNIQHSLKNYEYGSQFLSLKSLYEANELTNAINRIVEYENHEFTVKTIERKFKSHDLGSANQMLQKEGNAILSQIGKENIVNKLMEILEIKDKENRAIGITDNHIKEINQYLRVLNLVEDHEGQSMRIDQENGKFQFKNFKVEGHTIITQPGMRYCQAEALIESLRDDDLFASHNELDKEIAIEKIKQDVQGTMMEDIVYLETKHSLSSNKKIFKLSFSNLEPKGEFDFVIYDKIKNECEIFEVKHSVEINENQTQHLTNELKCTMTEYFYGDIIRKNVIYQGENKVLENGIHYLNVVDYLDGLKNTNLLLEKMPLDQVMKALQKELMKRKDKEKSQTKD